MDDFRELNKRLILTPFPLPNIRDLRDLVLCDVKYFTTLDILQGYYQLKLSPQSSDICTIVVPWGKFCYNSLPMGVASSPDLFQWALGDLFLDIQNVLIYLDNILIVLHGHFKKRLHIINQVLHCSNNKNMTLSAKKSEWAKSTDHYLGFILSQDGIRPKKQKSKQYNK